MASSWQTRPESLAVLADHDDEHLVQAVAGNPRTTDRTLLDIAANFAHRSAATFARIRHSIRHAAD
ncbi:hypothetical protein [Georgenia yuyongxinii]|uniref:Uncharacterized protein n=1 Tax=Georgenia yuyongxinii TaxID=2589797 RepID=A0A552WUN6_9MICO|nr:hypothetical protein [Georgenia yuyongxinii]TRW46405.1 hypothetical protein FJ693_05615 [Georgenia yuyongxinii]